MTAADWSGLADGPLSLLYETSGLPRFDLPAPLAAAYGGPLGFARPRVVANFVTSVDGVVALPEGGESGSVISRGSEADRFVMGLLRACADAVVVGAGTYRKAPGDLFDAAAIYPPAAALYADLRARLGLAPRPRFVLVTGSGAIDATASCLDGATLVTTARGAAALKGRVPASTRVATLAGDPLRVADVMQLLRDEGASLVLTEGGPTLFAELVRDRAVDELFLTTSPAVFGRFAGDGRKGLAYGLDLGGRPLELVSHRRHGSYLFARYALR